jgi:DNA-binding MarR family transcriptional regulator
MISEDLKLTNQLCFSIYNANRLFNKFYQKALEPFKITYPQYLVLLSLWERDQQQLQELGAEIGLSSNTLTPLLKRLEEKELITRVRPQTDKRQLVVSLTNAGEAIQAPIVEAIANCISQDQFDINRYHQLLEDNKKLADELQKQLE